MNPDAFITVVGQKNVNDTHYDLVETLTWYADRDNAAIDAHGTFNWRMPTTALRSTRCWKTLTPTAAGTASRLPKPAQAR
ncbi:hypothetical protein IU399_18900 [Salmonella enterica subsp. enterica serovar Worthington]|nr:hypothetical protein [Salmonella enterica subsp. enterica serovar Worthington]